MTIRTPPVPTARNSVMQAGKPIYLNNKELFAEVKRSKKKGQMSDILAKMFQLLCSKYAKKGNFVNYSYNEDMQAYALMMLVRTWDSFNPDKSNNPFAFYTQCIKNSFIQYLNYEKRERNVRDLMLIDQGLNPSYGFEDNNDIFQHMPDEQDFEHIRNTAENLNKTKFIDGPIERDDTGQEIVQDDLPDLEDDGTDIVQ